jgi:DNA-binding response OmpR family regulator
MGVATVLVVDDDPWILRMVTTVLEKRGHRIITALDGEEGLQKALAEPPYLVVTDVMMPKLDGWSLIKQLRAHPEFALVPVIFLTALGSDEDRIRGFRMGADDYLPKPFRFEEFDLRVTNALRRRAQVAEVMRAQVRAAQPKGPSGLQGTLDQLGLSSLLTLLEMERKSGILALSSPTGDRARIFLREGRVVSARFDGRPEPKNELAIYQLLRWDEGRFEFSALEVDMLDEIESTTTALLMEGARLIDEENDRRSS